MFASSVCTLKGHCSWCVTEKYAFPFKVTFLFFLPYGNTEDTATKNNTDKSEKTQESAGAAAEETDSVKNTDIKGETQVTVETPTLENAQNATQQAVYTPIDIRL